MRLYNSLGSMSEESLFEPSIWKCIWNISISSERGTKNVTRKLKNAKSGETLSMWNYRTVFPWICSYKEIFCKMCSKKKIFKYHGYIDMCGQKQVTINVNSQCPLVYTLG